MIEATRNKAVHARPGDVWALLADFGAISRWAPNVLHSCLMSDQLEGVEMARRVQTGRLALIETVVSWDPPVGLRYRLEGLPPILKSVSNEWRIEPVGNGADVSLTSRVDAGHRPPQQLLARVVAGRLAAASEVMLAGLADHLHRSENAS